MKALSLVLPLVLAAAAGGQQRVPVIVELFTSEGCSSCPPADQLLSNIERQQPVAGVELIALGEHVDYWDSLGWKDRFSSALFTARQQEYGRVFRLDSVYTPQVVVNGQAQALGSDWRDVQKAVRSAAEGPKATVGISLTGYDSLSFRIDNLPAGTRGADILLAVTESDIESAVERGENKGRRLRHSAVVRSLTSLGRFDAKKDNAYSAEARLNLNPQWNRRNLRLVLFVQDRTSLRILGAASIRL